MSIKGIARFFKGKKKHMCVSPFIDPESCSCGIVQHHDADRAQVRARLVPCPPG